MSRHYLFLIAQLAVEMKNPYDNYDDGAPSTQADFQVAESYRWVRTGLYFLLTAYVIFVPGIVFLVLCRSVFADTEGVVLMLLASTIALLVGMTLLIVGGLLLRTAPCQNEKNEANKFLIAFAIAFGCSFVSWVVELPVLDVIKQIARAYGTYFLIQFFEVLGRNRQNESLERLSSFLNQFYIVGILFLLGFSFFGKALGALFGIAALAFIVFVVVFYVLWMRMLWLAIKSTHFISSDVVRDYLD